MTNMYDDVNPSKNDYMDDLYIKMTLMDFYDDVHSYRWLCMYIILMT